MMRTERIQLMSPSPGTRRELLVHRLGQADARPKVYFQAGLHADEWPGLLVLQHLLTLLQEAERQNAIQGEIIVVPYANPVGLSQNVFGYVAGRFDLTGTGNFNRNFADLYLDARDSVEGRLGSDLETNNELVREALRAAVAAELAEDETTALKKTLLALSIDADYVFDLHCDDHSSAHVYSVKRQAEKAQDLCRHIGARYLLTEDLDGVVAFDGSHLQPWHWLQKDFPDNPMEMPKLAVTVEYRGQYDVSDELAAVDAANLFNYLVSENLIRGDAQALQLDDIHVSPLESVDSMKAEAAGLLVFQKPLDAWLEQGDVFAEIVSLDGGEPNQRTPVRARTAGYLMARTHRRLVRPGDQIAKVCGEEPLPHRKIGNLLQL
ncbi:succinylglutamate desuccinylase/aspartoacylase family protein [Hahella sp. NBU794]|uniref:succinylglutamate desuccinylase/aspartoacylase family protein n=1 Tax=Hahella sp. NBU794 TaxID=3422590 RepID=UPI003D6FD957